MQAKKNPNANNKESISENFLLGPALYDMTPPAPLPFPKMYHYVLDPNRHCQHRFSNAFLSNTKPLLIGCDVGLSADELILFSKEHNSASDKLDPEDEALLKQSLMDVKHGHK